MKTITQYQPLIFTRILNASRDREPGFRAARRNVGIVLLYCAAGLWLVFDTGFAPWNWQFWTVFGPLFVAGELAAREILSGCGDRAGCETV